ncbi:MAG: hypothetical protein AB1713_10120 [Pseudomonadota bacterium]
MNSILIFASLSLGLAFTLLFGPQWGIMMGLMAYLAGTSTLHSRELVKLKMELQQRMSELPDLVNQMVEQKLKTLFMTKASAATTDAPVGTPMPSPAPTQTSAIDERFSALDHKLSTLVDLLVARESRTPELQPERVRMDDAPPARAGQSAVVQPAMPTAPQGASTPPNAPATPQGEAVDSDAIPGKDHEAELAAMRELVEKMAAMLAAQGSTQDAGGREPVPAKAAPGAGGASGTQRPSLQQLREELDKIAHEVHNELGRPHPK